MKKLLPVLAIFAGFFIFQAALVRYDMYVTERFFDFFPGDSYFELSISGQLSVAETAEFQENLTRLLDSRGLYCYQRLYAEREYIAWVYTEDPYYFGNVYLTNGKLSAVRPGDYYFSDDGEQRGVIYSPIRDKSYKLYHLSDFTDKHKSVFIPYILYTYADDAEIVCRSFAGDLRALYPGLTISFQASELHRGAGNEPVNYAYLLFAVLTGATVIIGLNAAIISQAKKIQILKLEGYGSARIYVRYVLGHAGLVLLAAAAAMGVLYALYIKTDFANARSFLALLAPPCAAFAASVLAFSAASFAAILLIDVNPGIKGKSPLKGQKPLSYAVFALLLVCAAATVVEGAGYLRLYLSALVTERAYLARIENLYRGSYIKPEYTAQLGNIDASGALRLNAYLRAENDMAEVAALGVVNIEGRQVAVFKVSRNYARKYIPGAPSGGPADEPYLLLPENLSRLREQIYKALDTAEYRGFEGLGEVVFYRGRFAAVDPALYVYKGLNVPNAAVLVSGSFGAILTTGSYFTYAGDERAAQAYYDGLCEQFGTLPLSKIESVESAYIYQKSLFRRILLFELPIFFAVLLAVITNAFHIAALNCELHGKRYAVLRSEGVSALALTQNEAGACACLLLFAGAVSLRFTRAGFWELTAVICAYFVLHMALLWLVTERRTKNFAERLR
jgi:hypothetical protein